MKKRNLLVALVMAMVMLFAGCSSGVTPDKFVGKWTGTLDFTDHFEGYMVAQNDKLKDYANFENLTFTINFEFTKDTVSLSLDEASTEQFVKNAEAGIVNMIDAMAAAEAASIDVAVEDVFAGMGTTRDAYIQSAIASMQFDTMVSEMAAALELTGSYVIDEDALIVTYEDGTYEIMKFNFGVEDLSITISDGTTDFVINCQKAN